VIGPGWLPGYKPRFQRKRTLAYTRQRRRAHARAMKQDSGANVGHTEIVLFDHVPAQFPVATLHARSWTEALRMWIAQHWAWLRPRTIPLAAAVFGMLAVLQSAYYLAHQHDEAEVPYFYIEASPPTP
jgi:hypothetical protein